MAGRRHSSEHGIPVHIIEFPPGSAASPVRSLLSFPLGVPGWRACSVARRLSFLLGRRVCSAVAMRTRACAMRSRSGSGLGFPVTVIRCCRPLGRDGGAAWRRRRRGRVIAGSSFRVGGQRWVRPRGRADSRACARGAYTRPGRPRGRSPQVISSPLSSVLLAATQRPRLTWTARPVLASSCSR